MFNVILTDDVKYSTSDEDIAPLSTVIGIKSVDGIVLAATGFTKYLYGSTIFKINRFTALGSSGQVSQMKMLVEGLEQKLGNNVFSDLDLRTRIEDILLDLHKRYNLRSSKTLSRDTLVFKPSSILGVRLKDDSYCIYQIEFYEDGPRIDPIDVQEAVGSASIFAKHDLKEESRFLASYGKSFSDLELRYNIWVASYVVNKIKEFDADPIWFTWGTTKVAIIDKNGFADINIDKNGFADINDKKVSRPMFPNR